MTDVLDYAGVDALARAARDWPGDADEDQMMREFAVPICLSAMGVRPWEWERLSFHYMDVVQRHLRIPERPRPRPRPWTRRTIKIPPPLFDTLEAVVPREWWGQEEVMLVHAEIALAEREQNRRRLRRVARRAGIGGSVTWTLLRRTYEAWLKDLGLRQRTIDLRLGRKPK